MGHSKRAAYAAGIALTAILAGCGSDDDGGGDDSGGGDAFADSSAEDIVDAAQTAMSDLTSVHIDADLTSQGSNVTMDLSMSDAGNCEGSVSIDGAGLELRTLDGEGWFKAEPALWEAQAPDQADQIIAAVGDKWVVDTDGQFTSFCDLDDFMEQVTDPDGDELEKDGTDEVDGAEVVKVTSGKGTAFIASDEPHHILKIEASGESEGEASFSEFDEDVEVEAPADNEVVDLSTL